MEWLRKLLENALPEFVGAVMAAIFLGSVAWLWNRHSPHVGHVAFSVVTALLAYAFGVWIGRIQISEQHPTCADYGIRITSPQQGAYLVGQEFDVSGSYEVKPPIDSVLLINASPEGHNYWPQFIAEIDATRKTWKGKFLVGGDQPTTADIVVAIMGKSGRVLFDYFKKVGQKTGTWASIDKLMDAMVECDRVRVIRTK